MFNLFNRGKKQTARSTDRLPPGQKLVRGWPVLHEGEIPQFDPATWRLRLFGNVEEEVLLSWDQLRALPQSEFVRDFHCVTTWSRYDNRWGGVSVETLLGLVRLKEGTSHVLQHCYDGIHYTTNLSLEDFSKPDNLVATHHDGQALTPEHGGPVRMIVHHLYAWKSAKWLSGIEFLKGDRRGFWEVRGYHNRADPWLEERYSSQE